MATAQAVVRAAAPRGHAGPWARAAVARLSARLIRRSAIAVSVGMGTRVAVEAVAFRAGYPDEASREALKLWGQDPGIRIMAGHPAGWRP